MRPAAAILAEYADDAVILGPGGPAVQGKPALAPYLSGLFGTVAFRDVVGAPTDITVSGDLGVETGTYSWTLVPSGGSPAPDKGKYLHVWARGPTGWKVVRYMANSDIAAP
jgi:ketosteroid isomerase-like protein